MSMDSNVVVCPTNTDALVAQIQQVLGQRGQVCERPQSTQKELDLLTENLTAKIRDEFNRISAAVTIEAALDTVVLDNVLWVTFRKDAAMASVRVPLPIVNNKGLEFIIHGDVIRVVCDYWLESEQKRLRYHDMVGRLFCEDINTITSMTTDAPMMQKIIRSLAWGQAIYMTSSLQKLVDGVVNRFPLHETDMNSWAMNRRIMIIDPTFEAISDPNQRLEYQVEKNKKYYRLYGWTAIGLSDGVLADKNYLLTTDLRTLVPFGMYHNPQRNLYSTLNMKGDELPRVRSASMQALMKKNIIRRGWNLVTAILDTPLNFEDQILVDKRHLGLSHAIKRRFVIYGKNLRVKKGEEVKFDQLLGFSDDGAAVRMNIKCDEAKVSSIRKDTINLNGQPVDTMVVVVKGRRFLRDGTKFSNQHGNKGVVRFINLGHAIDPRTGKEVPIDVMISARSINKRRNFGQILEALTNNIMPGSESIVIADDYVAEKEMIGKSLAANGFPEDGTWMINTYCGEYQAIVGKIFWGVVKDPEDQTWTEERTELTNNRELRTSGLKFSHVEMKALVTRFGPNNPLVNEVLSHVQGAEILRDEIKILRSLLGSVDPQYPVVEASNVKCVDMRKGVFHTLDAIKGTVVDDEYLPEGFVLHLPFTFQVSINKKKLNEYTISPVYDPLEDPNTTTYRTDRVFIPNALLRRCWRHGSGKWGLNTLGMFINRIIENCHRFIFVDRPTTLLGCIRAINNYFNAVASAMGTKVGELSTYGMSVRYPYSGRATAVLADNAENYPEGKAACAIDNLPRNTVEIHTNMAKVLNVKSGDVILAERFPCLGFMSIRPQWVKVTDDPQCKYVIRVSGNSLVSETLDFDGDTLFLASFHQPASIELLRKEMAHPNTICETAIENANSKKIPMVAEMTLEDFEIRMFPTPSVEVHAEIVRKATGVKSHTGPVIALAYNLMRIVEGNVPYENTEDHVHLELLLDFLGNTVFKQKHGIRSLQEDATDAICTADVDKMVALGFDYRPSKMLCDLIVKEAASIGVRDLIAYHNKVKEQGGSKIINTIVRRKHRIYFATRARLSPIALLAHLQDPPKDLPSYMLAYVLRTPVEAIEEKIERLKAVRMKVKNNLATPEMREVYEVLSSFIDKILVK